jgi:ABC-type polysaccharide/polyol phosphate export systems, permease component
MYTFDIKSLLLFPIGVISIMCLGYTVGLLLTPIGILYTDVLMSIQMLMMFWMFVSPVVITMPTIGNVANVMRINPVTPLIETTRSWLIGINSNYLNEFFIVFGCSIIFLFVAWILYRVSLPHVVARIGM